MLLWRLKTRCPNPLEPIMVKMRIFPTYDESVQSARTGNLSHIIPLEDCRHPIMEVLPGFIENWKGVRWGERALLPIHTRRMPD
jgi:hypothetical protein